MLCVQIALNATLHSFGSAATHPLIGWMLLDINKIQTHTLTEIPSFIRERIWIDMNDIACLYTWSHNVRKISNINCITKSIFWLLPCWGLRLTDNCKTVTTWSEIKNAWAGFINPRNYFACVSSGPPGPAGTDGLPGHPGAPGEKGLKGKLNWVTGTTQQLGVRTNLNFSQTSLTVFFYHYKLQVTHKIFKYHTIF